MPVEVELKISSTHMPDQAQPPARRWYIAQVPRAHQGAGRSPDYVSVAIWAYNGIECLERIRRIRGYQRHQYAAIEEATPDECHLIERVIAITPHTSPRKARREWIFLFADVIAHLEQEDLSG